MKEIMFNQSAGYVVLDSNDTYTIRFPLGREQNLFSITTIDGSDMYSDVYLTFSFGPDAGTGSNVISSSEQKLAVSMNMLFPYITVTPIGIVPSKPIALHCKRK